MNLKFLPIFLLAFSPGTYAEVSNSFQIGTEYDSNAFKTFGFPKKDSVLRTLFKSQSRYALSENWEWGWNFQMGGKKYFRSTAKDLFIQYVEFPSVWTSSSKIRIYMTPDFKYQNEDNTIETLDPSLPPDANEDFYSPSAKLEIQVPLSDSFSVSPIGQYTFFKFIPDPTFSYHLEKGGISFKNQWSENWMTAVAYNYSRQQFLAGAREDRVQEGSIWFQFSGLPYGSLRYTYQNSDSSQPQFSYTNHRITGLLSIPFGQKTGDGEFFDPETAGGRFVFHILGTLQIKRFPSVFGSTFEGRRLLLTEAEDENFNSLLLKLTYHPTQNFAIEAKWNRYSNELSSQPTDFTRNLVYGGIRYKF